MSDKRVPKYPYQSLGGQLKTMREKHKESLAEVSGAVEVDLEVMRQIEQGASRPSEDILLLLISHFDVKEDEAVKLWELAGYSRSNKERKNQPMTNDDKNQQLLMVMQMDTRVIYTDTVQVSVNNYGVVMNFMQNAGNNGAQPSAVARVGMSKDHARSVIDLLERSLAQAEAANQPKSLPAPKTNRDQQKPDSKAK